MPPKRRVTKKPLNTVCLEGYKINKKGRCVKDKNYVVRLQTVPLYSKPIGPKPKGSNEYSRAIGPKPKSVNEYSRAIGPKPKGSNEYSRDSHDSTIWVESNKCNSLQKSPFHKKFLKQISEEGFTCQKELGSGGFGTTYLFSSDKGEKIAVKVIKAKHSLDITVKNEIDILERFKNKCSEEHLLCYKKIYNYESPKVQKKGIYIITEFIEGNDMYHLIIKRKISHSQFVNLLSQAIAALEYIHSVGIIHYDIKPQNMMITKDYKLKIIDFGGAKVSTDGNKSIPNYTIHTRNYVPKDVYFEEPNPPFSYGEYFDFYSLGKSFIGFDHKGVDLKTKGLLNLFDIMNYSNYKDILSQIKEILKVSIPLQKSKSVSVK